MEETLRRLRWPAISLIIAAAVSAVCSVVWLYAMVRLIFGDVPPGSVPIEGDEKLGYQLGQIYSSVVAIFSILAAPYVIKGAMAMLKGKRYNTARTAAILALVPFSSCCFVIGMPVGLWALSTLNRKEIREGFTD